VFALIGHGDSDQDRDLVVGIIALGAVFAVPTATAAVRLNPIYANIPGPLPGDQTFGCAPDALLDPASQVRPVAKSGEIAAASRG
jgi:hypothetical protein